MARNKKDNQNEGIGIITIIAVVILAILAIYLIICTSSYSIHLFAQLYAIMSNLTYDELFNSHKWGHLWEKVKYVPERKLVINEFSNPEDKGKWNNIKYYFGI